VTIVGAVQNPQVPWVTGLTLAQAIATANYVGADEPSQIIITRNGESAALNAKVLLDGTVIPLEIGDVVELR
jgi:protein involved in polysaccharide export with SLBB domain